MREDLELETLEERRLSLRLICSVLETPPYMKGHRQL